MSRLILVVGGTHRGKSYWIKRRIKGLKHLINDIKGEYGKGFVKYHNSGDRKGFVMYIMKNITKTICVFEEASFYLSNRHYMSEAEQIFVNKWQSLNTYILVYHSIRKIPLYVYDYADIMVLFKTKDQIFHIKNHPPEVLKAFESVNKKSLNNKRYFEEIILDDID